MHLDHVAGNRQAQTSAATTADPGPVHLVEALEDPGYVRSRNADPGIPNPDHDFAVVVANAHDDLAAFWAELHRVVQQVDQDLAQAILVAANRSDVLGQLEDKA